MDRLDLMLISMPFYSLQLPNIALGILKAVSDRAGIRSECRYFHLDFMEFMTRDTEPMTVADFGRILSLCVPAVGDWIFCVPPFRDDGAAVDERFIAFLRSRQISESDIATARRMRRFAPDFLRQCLQNVLQASPRLVGFSTMFSQNIASLALAKMIKLADPSIKIAFGGANCDGSMGVALHRSFPWIDVVVRGEGERALVELARDVQAERPFRALPGLCLRQGDEVTVTSPAPPIPMNEVPAPDYDGYFETLAQTSFAAEVRPAVSLLFEASRGCWWGEKAHCTFCGLNGSTMEYRSKSPDRVFDEVTALSRRHQQLRFWAVDNIIDMDYFHTLLPRFRESGFDLKLFYETKANLKRHHLRMMRDSGISFFQPGIESLSSPILKLMRKGVTALQNIRLLKWCREYQLLPSYHVLAGFPTEPAEEYDRMAELMPALWHLPPPDHLNRLHIDRFSPLHSNAAELGLENTPLDLYEILYPIDRATAMNLAYYFKPRYLDGREPDDYLTKCRDAIAAWNRHYRADAPFSTLHYRRGPGFVIVDDERVAGQVDRYTFANWQATAFIACDAGATAGTVLKAVHGSGERTVELDDVEGFLDALVAARLAYEEDGRYLTLPVAENPDGFDRARLGIADERTEAAPGLVAIGTKRAARG